MSENDPSNDSSNYSELGEEKDGVGGGLGEDTGSTVNADSVVIDLELLKEWAMISGRLIKIKSKANASTDSKQNQIQLISYNDKSMKKSSQTKNYTSSQEAVNIISAYILKGFKKAMLSTRENDFEFKLRKGQGKFRSTSKVKNVSLN